MRARILTALVFFQQVTTVLVNAVKEQQAQIEQQQKQIQQQQSHIERQQRQIEILGKLVCQTNPQSGLCK